MKSIIKNVAFYSLSLFVLTVILPGVKVTGGLTSYILSGAILSLMFAVLKPILSVIAFPLNMITLGLFSFLINAVILYLLTLFVSSISITSFQSNGFSFAGFIVPALSVNKFFAFVVASLILSSVVSFLTWLTKR